MASSVVVLLRAKLFFIFANFKMAASATSIKELNVLKQCCNPLNVGHTASSKKYVRLVLYWAIKKVPSIQKGQRVCDKCRKTIADLPKSFGNGAAEGKISHNRRKE
jgi:hypothetical protein